MGKISTLIIFTLLFLFTKSVSAIEPEKKSDNSLVTSNIFSTQPTLDNNYQVFQVQMLNLENNNTTIPSSLLIKRKKKNDYFMLYVAGGILVATGVLILANNPDNFVSNSATDAYLGIAIGGTVSSGMIIAKFFFDRR